MDRLNSITTSVVVSDMAGAAAERLLVNGNRNLPSVVGFEGPLLPTSSVLFFVDFTVVSVPLKVVIHRSR